MRKTLIMGVVFAAALGLVAACGGSSGGGGDTPSVDVCGGATMGCVTGVVQDSTGAAVTTGITVTTQGAAAAAQTVAKAATNLAETNSQGWFAGDNLPEGEQVLCYSGAGYVKKCVTVNIRAQQNTPLPPIKLPTRPTAVTVANVEGGAGIALEPSGTMGSIAFDQVNSVCDSAGTAVTGSIDCYLTPVDTNAASMPETAPETFAAIDGAGNQGTMVSSAMMEVTCEQGGAEVNLCTGKTATVNLPLYGTDCADAARNPTPLEAWRFNETTGNWALYPATMAKNPCGTGATDQSYTGPVDHFTWINGDKWRDDACLTGLVYTTASQLTGTNLTVQCWGSGWRNSAQVGTDGRFCIAVPNGYSYTWAPLKTPG